MPCRRAQPSSTASGTTPPYLGYWLGSLYVVVEGWKELGFSDPSIDDLLRDETHVELLRLYRNGCFHYQASYFEKRFVGLWGSDGGLSKARRLQSAFRKWFGQQPETRG
jgi:hypothetical protein